MFKFGLWVSVKERLVEEVKKNNTLIVVGETGSGKTTRKFSVKILAVPLKFICHSDMTLIYNIIISTLFCYSRYVFCPVKSLEEKLIILQRWPSKVLLSSHFGL